MQFLNSLILFGLGAAIIPLIIHLFSRRRAKEVAFPSLEFLERMKTDRMRRLRFRQLLALLLRTLIVAAVVLAFARPALRGMFQKDARTTAVIVLDGSASMGYVDNGEALFDAALRKTREIVTLLGEEDRAAIILAGREPKVLGDGLTSNRAELEKSLRSTVKPEGTGNITAAFSRALEILKSSPAPNRELYFISDCAANALPESLAAVERVRCYTVPVGPEKRGGTVLDDIQLVERILSPGRKITIRAAGFAGSDADKAGVEFFVNGERKGRTEVLSHGGRFEAQFEYLPENPGWYSVCATVHDGRFEAGETRRLTFRIPGRRNILLCGDSPEGMYFPARALNPDPTEPLVNVKTASTSGLTGTDFDGADVIVLASVGALPANLYRKLLAAVADRGAGLVVFPPRAMDPALYAQGIFRDLFPADAPERVTLDAKSGNTVSIDWFNFSHPIMQGITRGGEFHKPAVTSYLKLAPRGNFSVLARLTGGSPAITSASCGKGRVVVFAMDASPESSDLPLTGLFLPLFVRTVQFVSGDAELGGRYETGDPLREVVSGAPMDSPVTLKPEDSPARVVELLPGDNGAVLKGETAERPGFCTLSTEGRELSRFTVDTPRSEVRFARADNQTMARAFRSVQWTPFKESENIAERVRKERYGKELFGWFIALAAALLAVEMVVSRKA